MAVSAGGVYVDLGLNSAQFQSGLKSAGTQLDKFGKTAEGVGTKVEAGLSSLGRGVAGLAALGGISLGAREIIEFADAWTRANNSLKVAGLSGSELKATMGALYDAAQRQGAPVDALATLYGRAAQSAKELGATRPELVQFSEDVAAALRIAGTSPQEASGALLQLSQLLGSSRVQAEEFNSVNEAARPILQAVANGIEEAGGSVSKLKALVTAGEISNVAFFRGFQAGAEGLRDQAAQADSTVSQAFTRIKNALEKAVGELDKTSGSSKAAVENLGHVAEAIGKIPEVVGTAVDKLGELEKWLNSAGNSPFWEKLARLSGVTFTPEEAAANGITPIAGRDQGIAALKAGQGTALGAGVSPADLTGQKAPVKTIKASDYPVVSAKDKDGREEVDRYQRAVDALNRHTASLRLDAEMVGRSTYEVEKAHAAQDLLTAAKQKYGDEISPKVRQQIEAEAEAYGRAAAALDQARQKQQQFNELQQEVGSLAVDAIGGLADGTKKLNDVLADSLKLIQQMVLKAAIMGEGPLGGIYGVVGTGGAAAGKEAR